MIKPWQLVVSVIVASLAAVAGFAVSAPEAQAQAGWRDMGSVNGVQVWRLQDGARYCYVTEQGGISCAR